MFRYKGTKEPDSMTWIIGSQTINENSGADFTITEGSLDANNIRLVIQGLNSN